MVYEGVKWGLFEIYYQYTPGATTRRMRRLRKLRESTSLAIERELERASAIGLYQRDPNHDVTPRTQPSTSESLRRRRVDPQPSHRHDPPTSSSSRRDYATPRPSQAPGTPSRRTSITTPPATPELSEGWGVPDSPMPDGEGRRVCYDTIMLMRLEEIKEGLRLNDLLVSGVKTDAAARLSEVIYQQFGTNSGPTIRQLRYLLWLWRERDLNGRILLTWSNLASRVETSRTIARWKTI